MLRTAWRHACPQYRAGFRTETTHGWWQPGRSHSGPKKRVCCVTTRGRNRWLLTGLGHGPAPLPARTFGLGVVGFGSSALATFCLPPCRLPAAHLAQALRILTITLVPTPRLVRAVTPFAQADPQARLPPSGHTTALSVTVEGAHGRLVSQGKSPGRVCSHSPRALSKREPDAYAPPKSIARTKRRTKRL